MIAYSLLIEHYECGEANPCEYRHMCPSWHAVKRVWRFKNTLTTKLGIIHGHMARVARDVAKYAGHGNITYTGDVRIVKIDSDKLEPLWSDAETSAYKLGGLEAVKRLQKGMAAEARAAERARVKEAKAARKKRAA